MSAPDAGLRVMVVDDHEVVRNGIKAILGAQPDIEIVAEAATVERATAEAQRVAPDVVVMDVRLPDGSGVEATRDIRAHREQTRVLMLTSFPDDEALLASVVAGASGFLLKQVRGGDLVSAVRAVARGKVLYEPGAERSVTARLRAGQRLDRDPLLARLSPQEEQILDMIAAGLTNRQIGEQLGLAEKTVKNYVSGVLSKLHVARRSEAATYLVTHTRTPGI
jgi:DNA-binding NarL/FixJ family response regulator